MLSPLALTDTRAQAPLFSDPAAPIETRIDSLLASMTLEEKIQALGSDPSVPRLGLRLSGPIEGLHGVALGGPGDWGRVRNPDGTIRHEPVPTTQFPQAVGLGETWDVNVVHRVAAIEGHEAPAAGSIDIAVDVSNIGARDAEEVVQLYTQLPQSRVSRPQRSLQGFQRVAIKASHTQEVHFTLAARQLAYWDETRHRYIVEDGNVRLLVGASSADIRLRGMIHTAGTLALMPDLPQEPSTEPLTAH